MPFQEIGIKRKSNCFGESAMTEPNEGPPE